MTRRRLCRWAGWFAAANVGLCFLVGLRYLLIYPWPDSTVGIVYAPLAMLGNFTLLITLLLVVVLGPVIAIGPLRRTVLTLAVLVAAVALTLLVLDANVYVERRVHLSVLVAVLFEPVTWAAAGLVLAVAVGFEALLAGILWRWLDGRPAAGGRPLGAALAAAWIASQALHIWADAVAYGPVTGFTQAIPLYYPQTAKRLLARFGLVDPERVRHASLLHRTADTDEGELRYPLAPLQCAPPAADALNLLWIVIDALRPDAVDTALTPALETFRNQSLSFTNHWSTGNSSRMSAFGMFYGLPSTYFQSFYVAERAPLLLDQFRSHGYEIWAGSAAGFGSPTQMDRTTFAGVADLKSAAGLGRVEANRQVTNELVDWLRRRDGVRPFFALLWLNHSDFDIGPVGPELPPDGRYAANPEAQQRWDQYRRGLRVVDREVGRSLDALGRSGHAGNTIVLLISDHGFEFDDLGLGYYGHASNYSEFQLRTPFMIRWPGRAPRAYAHRTSNFDIPTTLLQELFGCRNAPEDYGMGRNLFAGESWDWIIAGSYHSWALVEPDRVTVSMPGGLAQVVGPDYRSAGRTGFDAGRIEQAIAAMRRFYR